MPRWRFVCPRADGTVIDVAIGGVTLLDAFEQYRAIYWDVGIAGTVGVWRNGELVARVRPVFNEKTQANEPRLEEWRGGG